jgi:recombination protein U
MLKRNSVKIMARYSNRGLFLEEMIEQANAVYNERGLAVIHKIPTPWKVQRKFSPYSKQYQISNAFPEKKATVDFGGTAQKWSVWFDVKATKNKLSFPLANIHQHQRDYLEKVDKQGGKAFILIHSEVQNKTWLIWINDLLDFIKQDIRKSLTFEWLDQNCEEVKSSGSIILDYLPIVLKKKEG